MDLDVFGKMPNRPDHPDHWKLSNVLLKLDSGLDPMNPDRAGQEAQYAAKIAELGIDPEVLTYASVQRAMRPYGVKTNIDFTIHLPKIVVGSGLWSDGFAAGVLFERNKHS